MQTFLAFVASALALATSAVAQSNSIAPGVTVKFENTHDTALCLGATSATQGAGIVATGCNAPNTAFTVVQGSNAVTQLVLSGTQLCISGSTSPLSLAQCLDDPNQRFTYETASRKFTNGNQCITFSNDAAGAPVTTEVCSAASDDAQKFSPALP